MQHFDGRDPALQQTRWRSDAQPIATIRPDEDVTVEVPDSSSGQLGPESSTEDLGRIDLDRVDAGVGPFEIVGALPGDAVCIDLLEVRPSSWGWSAIFREFGLLQNRWDDELVLWSIAENHARPMAGFLRPIAIPLRPMLGWVGVAPPTGDLGMIPPQRFGGNLDNRLHVAGATVELPVQVEGALLMIGDPHAAQGDGEVCGTGIETGATVRLRVRLRQGANLRGPRARVSEPATGPTDWLVSEGVGPDLKDAARRATEDMVRTLESWGFSDKEGYLLLSVAGQLRISEIVDEPNVVVSMLFPTALAEAAGRSPGSH